MDDALERVVRYIGQHLSEDLEINQLAEIAHFSPYHFHRIYREMMGEPVKLFVVIAYITLHALLLALSSLF